MWSWNSKLNLLISAGIKPLFSSLSLWETVCMRMVWCKLTDFVSWALLLGNTSVSDLLSCIRVWNHWSLKQRHCLLGNTYSSYRSDGNWIWNVYCNFKELWKWKSTHSYVTHAFIRCSGGDLAAVEAYKSSGGDIARQLTADEVRILNRPSAFDTGFTLVHLAIRFQRQDMLAVLLTEVRVFTCVNG